MRETGLEGIEVLALDLLKLAGDCSQSLIRWRIGSNGARSALSIAVAALETGAVTLA